MWLRRMRDRYLNACVACRQERAAVAPDALELLLTYYIDLDPRPELFGELLARCLGAEDHDPTANSVHPDAGSFKEW
jgi:hypothetical protein